MILPDSKTKAQLRCASCGVTDGLVKYRAGTRDIYLCPRSDREACVARAESNQESRKP